ncbi:hypothetical protein [Alkalitalea saponilacus]|uniref:Uncharacterized protein n=1 Tax=Alkalitalea saponilacus TaxID=889453 RepID=A0A1T5HT57_9BACT|nr:hypothetical protein [Alkalitalea saponilacus]ASB48502.1 hypothetical protein CDL62_04800 [Alkalitalea saponilacus]SKC23875.1 hypothetical protein SAMN03080601_03160 [Alkalitalea saponilacus]
MSKKLVFGIPAGLSLLLPAILISYFFREMPEPLGNYYDSPLMVVGAGLFIWLMAFGVLMIIYTHWNEKIRPSSGNRVLLDLPQHEHNIRAEIILSKIFARLAEIKDEDDEENNFYTIVRGRDAKFIKRGLDYINTRLNIDDPDIVRQFNYMKNLYNEKLKRSFTGSWWIIIAAFVVAGMMEAYADYPYIMPIYIAGIVLYFFASKVPLFLEEKRYHKFGRGNLLSRIAGFLFSDIGGSLDRARNSSYGIRSDSQRHKEDVAAYGDAVSLVFNIFVLLFIASFVVVFAVWKFFYNFWSRNLLSLSTLDQWYEKNISN